jgi:hypothetical protein
MSIVCRVCLPSWPDSGHLLLEREQNRCAIGEQPRVFAFYRPVDAAWPPSALWARSMPCFHRFVVTSPIPAEKQSASPTFFCLLREKITHQNPLSMPAIFAPPFPSAQNTVLRPTPSAKTGRPLGATDPNLPGQHPPLRLLAPAAINPHCRTRARQRPPRPRPASSQPQTASADGCRLWSSGSAPAGTRRRRGVAPCGSEPRLGWVGGGRVGERVGLLTGRVIGSGHGRTAAPVSWKGLMGRERMQGRSIARVPCAIYRSREVHHLAHEPFPTFRLSAPPGPRTRRHQSTELLIHCSRMRSIRAGNASAESASRRYKSRARESNGETILD